MYVEIEKTGTIAVNGLVQIRFAMYLDKDDYGYEKHYIYQPMINSIDDYPGEKNQDGSIITANLQEWFDTLPHEWVNNPFHNHFVLIEPNTSDEEIMDIGEAFLNEAYIKWASDEKIDIENPIQPLFKQNVDPLLESMCDSEVEHLTLSKDINNFKRAL